MLSKDGKPAWLKLSKRVYRKELLPVGEYRKEADDLDFEISLSALEHIAGVTNDMIAAGIKVPLVKGHDGGSSFGNILKCVIQKNNEGLDSSFIDVEFSNDRCVEEALDNDVSAFIPPEFVDGRGNAWKRPLRHVAITPYPVIPGLGTWESIAASFHSSIRKSPMLEDLSKALSLSFTDEDDTAKEAKIVDAVKTLAGQAIELADQLSTLKKEKATLSPPAEKPDPIKYPESVVLSFGRARSREINDLVRDEKITPAVGKDLVKRYCSSKAVALSLAEGESDDFSSLLQILAKNRAPRLSGRMTKAEYALRLSHGGGKGSDSPLVEAARKKAEAIK